MPAPFGLLPRPPGTAPGVPTGLTAARLVGVLSAGAVTLAGRRIKAGLSGEVPEVGSPMLAAEVGVCWVPVPAGGDRARGALVPALLPVLPRCGGAAD